MASFELDEEPLTGSLPHRLFTRAERAAMPRIRRRLVRTFLRASGIEDQARAVARRRRRAPPPDRSVRPGERRAVQALVAREAR